MPGSVNGYAVRAHDGRPIAGATITVVRGAGPVPDIAFITDADGYFGLDGLQTGEWELRAFGPTGGKGEATVPVFDNAVSDVTIVLDGLHRWLADALTGVTDGSTDVASENQSSELKVEQEMASRAKGRPVRSTGKTQTAAPGSLRGRVLLADNGMPLSDATVSVVSGVGLAPDIAPMTDAVGRFSFEGLTPGWWKLRALGPNGESGEAEVRVYDNAPADMIIEVERQASAIGSIWGRVVLADTGFPVSDAAVSVESGAELGTDLALKTDAAGRFVVEGVPTGTWVLRALTPHGQSGEAEIRISDVSPAYLVIEVEQRLPAISNIQGRVLLADTGMPVSEATLSVVSGAGPAPDIASMTDAAGRFSVDGLASGTWLLRVIGPKGECGEAEIHVAPGAVTDLTITTERPTLALELVGRECRVYREGDALSEELREHRVNIELDRAEGFIRRIWIG